jgi:hypothetical protein
LGNLLLEIPNEKWKTLIGQIQFAQKVLRNGEILSTPAGRKAQ